MDCISSDKPFCLDVFVFLAFNAISMILLSQKLLHSKIFYPAQNYHNDYYDKHYDAPHCNVVIDHKIAKLFQKEEYNHYEMEHNHSVRVDLQKHVY
jgi:hypothetical protein